MESPGEQNQGDAGEFTRQLIMDKFKEVASLEHLRYVVSRRFNKNYCLTE